MRLSFFVFSLSANFVAAVVGAWDTSTTATAIGIMGAFITCVAGLWPTLTTANLKGEMARRTLAVEDCERRNKEDKADYEQQIRNLKAEFSARFAEQDKYWNGLRQDWDTNRARLEELLRAAEVRGMRWKTRWEIATGQRPTPSDADMPFFPPNKEPQ